MTSLLRVAILENGAYGENYMTNGHFNTTLLKYEVRFAVRCMKEDEVTSLTEAAHHSVGGTQRAVRTRHHRFKLLE